ncbi:unnamed protein product, partial [Symbiodinium necroappetens]
VDYTGDEVLHALPLKASEIAEGDVAKWLLDPELTLLPRDKWPSPLPRASMNCTREDWCELVPLLVKKRILEPISKSEIFTVNGAPVLNGAFAVPKKGVFLAAAVIPMGWVNAVGLFQPQRGAGMAARSSGAKLGSFERWRISPMYVNHALFVWASIGVKPLLMALGRLVRQYLMGSNGDCGELAMDMTLHSLSWNDLDEAICAWIEFAYSEGEHKSLVNFALAGLQFYLPACVGKLKQAWRLAKVWQRLEPPLRVLPLSPLLTSAFAGACVLMGFIGEAAGFLIGFDCMLRSGELYNLRRKDITFMRDKAVLSLGKSKTGKRTGANEMVVVESCVAVQWLREACSTLHPDDRLLFRGERFFRKLFHALVEFFETPGLLTVYSLRRGGATWNFLFHGSMEKTLLRGRWSSTST